MSDGWTQEEKISVIVSFIAVIVLGAILSWALSQASLTPLTFFGIAVGGGGLGGLVHEFAQSRGKILFMKKFEDGIYLGSISGIILGIVAGILILQNLLTSEKLIETANITKAAVDAFMAGLALKGVAEAATSVPQ